MESPFVASNTSPDESSDPEPVSDRHLSPPLLKTMSIDSHSKIIHSHGMERACVQGAWEHVTTIQAAAVLQSPPPFLVTPNYFTKKSSGTWSFPLICFVFPRSHPVSPSCHLPRMSDQPFRHSFAKFATSHLPSLYHTPFTRTRKVVHLL